MGLGMAMISGLVFHPSVYAADTQVTLENGGMTIALAAAPERAIAMNQAAVEIMLSLGLEDRMVGTAYLDDQILPELANAYRKIPILAKQYPSKEVILAANPDFVYASFSSAFSEKRGLPTRKELAEMGIGSYLSPSESPIEMKTHDHWRMDLLYKEIREIGKIFRVNETAAAFIAKTKSAIANERVHTTGQTASGNKKMKRPTILWLDSFNTNGVFIGGSTGVPNEIIRLSGGKNTFSDIKDSWKTVSQEQVISRPIDLIVLIDATWDTADQKRKKLFNDPVYADLEAVRNNRFVEIHFSASMPGIRIPMAVQALKSGIQGLLGE